MFGVGTSAFQIEGENIYKNGQWFYINKWITIYHRFQKIENNTNLGS